MHIVIKQKQEEKLYEEHVKSLHSFTFLGKHELSISLIVLVISFILLIFTTLNAIAWPAIIFSFTSILRYPKRENRWIKTKIRKTNNLTEEKYSFTKETLVVTDEISSTTIAYSFFHKIITTNTGILFFINPFIHLYISFDSFQSKEDKEQVINTLSSVVR